MLRFESIAVTLNNHPFWPGLTGFKIRDTLNGSVGQAVYLTEKSLETALAKANNRVMLDSHNHLVRLIDKKGRHYSIDLTKPLKGKFRKYEDEKIS